ncbi:hypothetical protein OnM2_012029 [Erysiphe neolycopersici]|uniref:Lipoprotein n=1 Tax=Erysiphe neolycopersici TaxID=212602 RepID=A0A420I674_9PEZI|nr:hypothetical protein OnM2_012029 [Erysiphe neolycopersici]
MLFRTSTFLLTLCLLYAGCGSAMDGGAESAQWQNINEPFYNREGENRKVFTCGNNKFTLLVTDLAKERGVKVLREFNSSGVPSEQLIRYLPEKNRPGFNSQIAQPYYATSIISDDEEYDSKAVVIFNSRGRKVDVALQYLTLDSSTGKKFYDYESCTQRDEFVTLIDGKAMSWDKDTNKWTELRGEPILNIPIRTSRRKPVYVNNSPSSGSKPAPL